MKLLLENWRKYSGEHDFDVLCENYDRGLITEIGLYEAWDRQVMLEMQSLIDEGAVDTLKKGYEALKAGAKEEWAAIKSAYEAAAQKVSKFILDLSLQAWQLIQKGKVLVSKIVETLQRALAFVKKFCAVHPLICKVVVTLITIIVVTAIMAYFGSEAQAAVETEQGIVMSDEYIDAVKGLLRDSSDTLMDAASAGDVEAIDAQQKIMDAANWLDKAHAAEDTIQLAQTSEEAAKLISDTADILYRSVKEGEMNQTIWSHYVELGKEAVSWSSSFYSKLTGAPTIDIKWTHLAPIK